MNGIFQENTSGYTATQQDRDYCELAAWTVTSLYHGDLSHVIMCSIQFIVDILTDTRQQWALSMVIPNSGSGYMFCEYVIVKMTDLGTLEVDQESNSCRSAVPQTFTVPQMAINCDIISYIYGEPKLYPCANLV